MRTPLTFEDAPCDQLNKASLVDPVVPVWDSVERSKATPICLDRTNQNLIRRANLEILERLPRQRGRPRLERETDIGAANRKGGRESGNDHRLIGHVDAKPKVQRAAGDDLGAKAWRERD